MVQEAKRFRNIDKSFMFPFHLGRLFPQLPPFQFHPHFFLIMQEAKRFGNIDKLFMFPFHLGH